MIMSKWICRSLICLHLCLTVACAEVTPSKVRKAGSNSKSKVSIFRLDTMCGPNCLWQIATVYGKDCSPRDIAEFAGTRGVRGTTVNGMVQACKKIGLPAKAVRATLAELAGDPRVAILLLETDKLMHYVILDRIGDSKVRLLNAAEFREIPVSELKSVWKGVAILIGDPPDSDNRRLGIILQLTGIIIVACSILYYMVRRGLLTKIVSEEN